MKAAADKLICWGRIDGQLWFRIFSKLPPPPPSCGKLTRGYWMLFQTLTSIFLATEPYTTELCTKETLKRAKATTKARSAIETLAPLPTCATDAMGVTQGSTAEFNSLSATSVAMYTQEAIIQQARPNQINPLPRKQLRGITTSLQMIGMIYMYTIHSTSLLHSSQCRPAREGFELTFR